MKVKVVKAGVKALHSFKIQQDIFSFHIVLHVTIG